MNSYTLTFVVLGVLSICVYMKCWQRQGNTSSHPSEQWLSTATYSSSSGGHQLWAAADFLNATDCLWPCPSSCKLSTHRSMGLTQLECQSDVPCSLVNTLNSELQANHVQFMQLLPGKTPKAEIMGCCSPGRLGFLQLGCQREARSQDDSAESPHSEASEALQSNPKSLSRESNPRISSPRIRP